jgi:hypothetical protein
MYPIEVSFEQGPSEYYNEDINERSLLESPLSKYDSLTGLAME